MNEIGFLVFYLLGLIPTYILPYFGFNSSAAKAVGAGLSATTNTSRVLLVTAKNGL